MDPRNELLLQRFGAGLVILEVGCGDGRHTKELATFAREVYAIDGRIENLQLAQEAVCSAEHVLFQLGDVTEHEFPKVDVVHHIGVLYHLPDPVEQLHKASDAAARALLLDTHYTQHACMGGSHGPHGPYISRGREWGYTPRTETPSKPREGLTTLSRWLLLSDITRILGERWRRVEIIDDRIERNGPRVTILATEKH